METEWTDPDQKTWSTRCELSDLARLSKSGFDVRDAKRVTEILADPQTLLNCVVEFFRPQFEKLSPAIDDLGFMVLLTKTDDSFSNATSAMLEGIRDALRRAHDIKRIAVLDRAVAAVEAERNAVLAIIKGPEVDRRIQREIDKATQELERQISEGA